MATIKKMMKKSAPKKAKMGTTTSMTTKKPLSDKDSMNIYANRYDELSASGVKKMSTDKKGSAKDLKAASEARKNEKRLAKKLYGTTPSNKKGGVTKKKMNMGGMMKMGGKMSKTSKKK